MQSYYLRLVDQQQEMKMRAMQLLEQHDHDSMKVLDLLVDKYKISYAEAMQLIDVPKVMLQKRFNEWFIAFAIMGILFVGTAIWYRIHSQDYSLSLDAKVTRSYVRHGTTTRGGTRTTDVIELQYELNGQTYQYKFTGRGLPAVGTSIGILVDPEHPEEPMMDGNQDTLPIIFISLGVAFLMGAFFATRRKR